MVLAIMIYVDYYKQDLLETDTSQYAVYFTTELTEPTPPGAVNHNKAVALPLHRGCACCAVQPCSYIRLTVVAFSISLRHAATHYRRSTPSMLDPISALSLSAAILQFVDFGSKIIVTTYKTYRSVNGTTQENVDLAELTTTLHDFQTRLAAPRAPSRGNDIDQKALEELAAKCRDIAADLLKLLNGLKVKVTDKGLRRTLNSLRQGYRSSLKKGQVARYEKLLGDITVRVNSHLLAMTR